MEDHSNASGGEPVKTQENGGATGSKPRSWVRRMLFAALLVLGLLGCIFAVALRNLNRLIEQNRAFIVAQIQQAFGRDFAAESLEVSIITGGRIHLRGIAISDDLSYSSEPFLRADEFSVGVALLPLLRKEIRLKKLAVHHPEITLIRNASGELNVSTLGVGKGMDSSAKPGAHALEIQDIAIVDGSLLYRDLSDNSEFRIDRIELQVFDIQRDSPVSFRLDVAFPSRNGGLSLEGRVGSAGPAADWHQLPFEFDLAAESLDADALLAAAKILHVSVPLPKDIRITGPFALQIQGRQSGVEAPISVAIDATETTVEYSDSFSKPAGQSLRIGAQLRVTPVQIALDSGGIEIGGMSLDATGRLGFDEPTPMRISVRSENMPLARLDRVLPGLKRFDLTGTARLETEVQFAFRQQDSLVVNGTALFHEAGAAIPQLRKRLEGLNGKLAFDRNHAELEDTTAIMGNSRFRLSARTDRFAPLDIACNVTSDEVRLDDLIWLNAGGHEQIALREVAAAGNATWAWNDPSRSHADQGALSIHGSLASAAGTTANFDYRALRTEYVFEKETLELENLELQTCEGLLEGGGVYGFAADQSNVSTHLRASGINIALLSRVMKPEAAHPPQGYLDGDLQLAGRGSTWDELLSSLHGALRLSVRGVRIPAVHAARFLPAAEKEFPLGVLDLHIDDLRFDRPVAFRLEAVAPLQEERLSLEGQIGPTGTSPNWRELPFDVQFSTNSLDAEKLLAAADKWILGASRGANLHVQGPLALEIHATRADDGLPLSVSLDATRNSIEYKEHFKKAAGIPLRLHADLRITPDRIILQPSQLNLRDTEIAISGEYGLGESGTRTLVLNSREMKLDGLNGVLPQLGGENISGTAALDVKVRQPPRSHEFPVIDGSILLRGASVKVPRLPKRLTELNGELVFHGQRVELRNCELAAGDSRLGLSAETESLIPLRVEYHLASGEFHSGDFIVASMERPVSSTVLDIAGEGRLDSDWEDWNDFNFDHERLIFTGTFTSTSGTLTLVPYEKLRLDLSMEKGVLSVKNLALQACGGTVVGEATYGLHPAPQIIETRLGLRDIDITSLSYALDPVSGNPLSGRFDSEIQLTGSGPTWDDFRTTYEGPVRIEIRNGRLPGLNIVQSVLFPMTLVPKLGRLFQPVVKNSMTDVLAANYTEFSEMKANIVIHRDKVRIADLTMKAPDWSVRGDGDILFDQRIDAKGKLTLSPRFVSAIVRSVKEVGNVTEEGEPAGIPFVLKGALPSVKPVPDVKSMAMVFPRLLGGTAGGIGAMAKTLLDGLIPPGKADAETASATQEAQEKKNPIREGLGKLFRR